MISTADAPFIIETEKMYIITKEASQEQYRLHYRAEKVEENFTYSSDKAQNFLSLAELQEKLKNYQIENT